MFALDAQKATVVKDGERDVRTSLSPDFLGLAVAEPDAMGLADLRGYIAHLQRNDLQSQRFEAALVEPPGDATTDAWHMIEVARRLGHGATARVNLGLARELRGDARAILVTGTSGYAEQADAAGADGNELPGLAGEHQATAGQQRSPRVLQRSFRSISL